MIDWKKFTRKKGEVCAIRVTEINMEELAKYLDADIIRPDNPLDRTLEWEGKSHYYEADIGDWIIRSRTWGEDPYPLSDEQFKKIFVEL